MAKHKKRKAFTIIEIVVSIVIIGILFIVFYSRSEISNEQAKITGVKTDFRVFYTAVKSVGLEDQLYLLSEDEFEKRLNHNLDIPLQFTDGVSAEKDPWGYEYVYVTHLDKDAQTFYIMFASKGKARPEELTLDDVIKTSQAWVSRPEESQCRFYFAVKQTRTEFSALDKENTIDAEVFENLKEMAHEALYDPEEDGYPYG